MVGWNIIIPSNFKVVKGTYYLPKSENYEKILWSSRANHTFYE